MKNDFTNCSISVDGTAAAAKVGYILATELEARTGILPTCFRQNDKADLILKSDKNIKNKDSYRISSENDRLILTANGIRGLMFAIGMFLRKTEYRDGKITLIEDIDGEYAPYMKIRGHQLGYRTTPNTYDAWDIDDYERYYKDLMFFGVNTVEHIPSEGNDKINELMHYTPPQMCRIASEKAAEYDLDVSLWYPNAETGLEEAIKNRKMIFNDTPRIDAVFPPGGDPGDLPATEFIGRTKSISDVLKKIHPQAEIWPSAQAPHGQPNWGNEFIEEMEKLPQEIDGVILGPNRAMDLDELRYRLPMQYPIRLYPDITHNVRCEYPVHFDRDDWHFAWAATESRESVNPRPKEYRFIHRQTRPYIIGSVSYSEGVHDDLNKMIWSDMDYFGETDLRVSVSDYVRLFFPGCDIDLLTDAIFGLEENWQSDPAESASVEPTYKKWLKAGKQNPELYQNWRYAMHLFRATCDLLVKKRRIFETDLIRKARILLNHGDINGAKNVLQTPFTTEYLALREQIEEYAAFLFKKIGLQLDVKRYHTNSWERGATLDTIDNNVTNRAYYLGRFAFAEQIHEKEQLAYLRSVFAREKADKDEFYYSVALHGLEGTGIKQEGYVYLNFRGDNPDFNRQSSPVGIMNVYDNYTFKCKVGGLTADCDYELRVTYLSKKNPDAKHHTVLFNGHILYDGPQFGTPDTEYDTNYLPNGFESAVYIIPKESITNGCGLLELKEDTMGVMFSEFTIKKRSNNQ